jgi:hypothetical protein
VLRGSFTLVLDTEKMDFLDGVAKTAFTEIMDNYKSVNLTASSSILTTRRLQHSSSAPYLDKLPGVYVIQNIEKGTCVIGQTTNLKSRFNQYISRGSRKTPVKKDTINKAYYRDAQDVISRFGRLNIAFQRYVVYNWVDDNNKPLDMDSGGDLSLDKESSLKLKNEMYYLEHRLILAFFECGLCYNTVDVAPQLSNLVQFETSTEPNPLETKQPVGGNKETKPFKVKNVYFLSMGDFTAYQDAIGESRTNHKRLRDKLKKFENNLNEDTRYLSKAEIEEAHKKNLFRKVVRESSPYKPKKKS